MSSNESMTKGSLYEYWAEKYAQFRIWDMWHISYDEYIDRPSFLIESLNQTAERVNARDLAELERLKTTLGK